MRENGEGDKLIMGRIRDFGEYLFLVLVSFFIVFLILSIVEMIF